MCGVCGCAQDAVTHSHDGHSHDEEGHHDVHHVRLVQVEQDLLAKNNQFAQANRQFFLANQITAINMMSSPGSGKTTLLASTFSALHDDRDMVVVVGDQHTDYDAQQLQASGVQAIQVNTGKVCHLDAHRIGHVVEGLTLNKAPSLLVIENVGNLVCPALFDLGEQYRVVMLSVTEGENKPIKYADMFRRADLMILTKMDLLPYVDFNVNQCIEFARRINPKLQVMLLSAKTGEGMSSWFEWLEKCDQFK